MNHWSSRLRATLALLSTLSALSLRAADSAGPERLTPVANDVPIPVEDFFKSAALQQPALNPSGSHVAALITAGGDKVQLLIYDVKAKKSELVGADANLNMSSFNWLNDERLIYSLDLQGQGQIGIMAVNLEQLNRPYPILQFENEQVVSVPLHDRVHPLIWERYDTFETGKQGGVVAVDTEIRSGKLISTGVVTNSTDSLLVKDNNTLHTIKRYPFSNASWMTGFIADQPGNLDFSTTLSGGVPALHRLVGENWQDCAVDLESIAIVGAGTKSGELAVVGPRGTGQPRPLQFMDGLSGKLGEVLIQDKEYDFNGWLYRDPGSRAIVGATFDRAAPQTVWFHPVYEKLQQVLNGFFPGVIARIIGNNEKGDLILVNTFSDRQPPSYQWVDLATKQVGLINNAYPWLDPKRMQPMSMIKFKTRDGHRLDAYVTMPAGASKASPPPLVVLPHDGPLQRDRWGFNPEVQFFASRGYAVLQPNYRGSPGTGWMFPESDDWDYVKMSEDVIDATRAFAASGYVDAKRVGIVGTAFGGYLALACATGEPDLYRCSAAIGGTFDWEARVNDAKFSRFTDPAYDQYVRKLGDPDKDKAKYEALSPIRRVNRLRGPVFVAVGKEDWQMLVTQTKNLISELEKNRIPHQSVYPSSVGRSMAYLKNRVDVYTQLEGFLAKNLK